MADPVTIQKMLAGFIPKDKIQIAINDAPAFMRRYGVKSTDCDYDLKLRYMVCHILYINGINPTLLSKAVADVNVSFADRSIQGQDGMSPYLEEFFILLDTSDFIVDA